MIDNPPQGVEYIVSKPRTYLRFLYHLFHKYGSFGIVSTLINKTQNVLFNSSISFEDDIDLVQYAQRIPPIKASLPYVVDFSHAAALASYTSLNDKLRKKIIDFLLDKNCKKVIPTSEAAKKTLKILFKKDYIRFKSKVEVVYPAVPNYYKIYKESVDYSIIQNEPNTLKILFVGNNAYRKGLHELLEAFSYLEKKFNIKLFIIISDLHKKLKNKYRSKNIIYLKPKYPKEEIIRKFFIPADLFVLPTHADLFGLVFLDAISSGTPVITTNQYATPEIVSDDYTGLFVKSNRLLLEEKPLLDIGKYNDFTVRIKSIEKTLVQDLIKQISRVCIDKELLKRMSHNAIKTFNKTNKFSIRTRNKKLFKIYKEALQS